MLHFAETLTFKGKQPVVTLIEKVYQTGVKLTQQAMAELEQQIQRLPNLPKWFVEITSNTKSDVSTPFMSGGVLSDMRSPIHFHY